MKKSGVYKRKGRCFRYDYERNLVIWVAKATEEEYAENRHWQEKFGADLWDIDKDGYFETLSIGMKKSNWEDMENRNAYLDLWIEEIEVDIEHMLSDEFQMYA